MLKVREWNDEIENRRENWHEIKNIKCCWTTIQNRLPSFYAQPKQKKKKTHQIGKKSYEAENYRKFD